MADAVTNRGFMESYGRISEDDFELEAKLDAYQRDEMEPSWATQLDTAGMQPHAREYLERQVNCGRSDRKFEDIYGSKIDYCSGIQFTGKP